MIADGWGADSSYTSSGVTSITKIDITKNVASGSIYSLQVTTVDGLLGRQVPNPIPFSVPVTPL